jgi:hypothetical protein
MTTDREERLQRYLDGRMPPEEHDTFEQLLLSDPELFGDAYDEIAVRETLAEVRTARQVLRPPRRRWALPFLAVAAAASIAFVVFILPGPSDHPVFRGGEAAGPRAVTPVGTTSTPVSRFVWTGDPAAAGYRFEIFGPDGARFHVETTSDTFLVLSPAVAPPVAGAWQATSLDSIGVGVRGTGRVAFRTP